MASVAQLHVCMLIHVCLKQEGHDAFLVPAARFPQAAALESSGAQSSGEGLRIPTHFAEDRLQTTYA